MRGSKEFVSKEELKRIKILKKYDILDTPPDESFDKFTKLAAQLLEVPYAVVSLVDTDRIWFKSKYGLDVSEVDRDPGLCATAISFDEIYIIENAKEDPRSLSNPLVAGKMGLQFYASVPLKTKEGFNLGALCVMDKKPRNLSKEKQEILRDLGDLVMRQMELRLEAITAVKHHHNLLSITAHDLKNPLSIMPLLADLIIMQKHNPDAIEDIAKQIRSAEKRMTATINDLLETAREETGRIQLKLKPVDLEKVVENVVQTNNALAKQKDQKINLIVKESSIVYADQQRLTEILDNLVNNAIKYSPSSKNIEVMLMVKKKCAVIAVKDEGQGLTKDDKRNLFRSYTSLSAQPTGGEKSSGLGLSIVKGLVDAHRGKVYAESDGKGKGSTFVVELPLSDLS